MGHAGAIITGLDGRADEKIRALSDSGVTIIPAPGDIGDTVQKMIRDLNKEG